MVSTILPDILQHNGCRRPGVIQTSCVVAMWPCTCAGCSRANLDDPATQAVPGRRLGPYCLWLVYDAFTNVIAQVHSQHPVEGVGVLMCVCVCVGGGGGERGCGCPAIFDVTPKPKGDKFGD